jgi:oxysterol-binding protein-related protein 8
MASDDAGIGEEPEYEEKLDDKPKSVLLSMMKQLRTGMDLSKVTLPTFILEPRSFLEKCSDYMLHGMLLQRLQTEQDALSRFVMVCKWYLAGWHFKPPGVKKPYNPILGEVFQCRFDWGDAGNAMYVGEQVSHHPPISAFHSFNRKGGWQLHAVMHPKTKFLGNSAGTCAFVILAPYHPFSCPPCPLGYSARVGMRGEAGVCMSMCAWCRMAREDVRSRIDSP